MVGWSSRLGGGLARVEGGQPPVDSGTGSLGRGVSMTSFFSSGHCNSTLAVFVIVLPGQLSLSTQLD